ncbi:hypothetical protein ABGB16_11840 [Micromonospora sp. B11E3]
MTSTSSDGRARSDAYGSGLTPRQGNTLDWKRAMNHFMLAFPDRLPL